MLALPDKGIKDILKKGGDDSKAIANSENDVELCDLEFQELEDNQAEDLLKDDDVAIGDAPEVRKVEDLPALRSKVPGMGHVQVRFDHFSHWSRNRRCWVTRSPHTSCQKWVYCKDYRSHQHAASYLLAWIFVPAYWAGTGAQALR